MDDVRLLGDDRSVAVAWVIALIVGSLFGVLRTVPNNGCRARHRLRRSSATSRCWCSSSSGTGRAGAAARVDRHLDQAAAARHAVLHRVDVCLGLFTGARVRAGALGHQRAAAGQKNAGLAMGFTLADLPLRAAADGVPDHRAAAHVRVPEHLQELGGRSTIGLLDLAAQARQLVDYTAQTYESFIAVTLAYVVINLVVMTFMRWIEGRTRLPGYIGGK
jgi:glutamate/aspartate transport system permease protein